MATQKPKTKEQRRARRVVRRKTPIVKMPGLEKKVVDLIGRLQDAMQEAVENEIPAEDAPVYLAHKRDVYAAHVLIVLEDLGIKMKVPTTPTGSTEP